MKIEDEDFTIDNCVNSELTYYDSGSEYVDIYLSNNFIGYLLVWIDVDNENKEYIIINHEIIYLDTIQLLNPEDNDNN